MLSMLVICFNLLLIPAAHARYPECREWEKGGISDLVFILKKLSRGRSACLRWSARWKAAKRVEPSAGRFSSPGLLHMSQGSPLLGGIVESFIDGGNWT